MSKGLLAVIPARGGSKRIPHKNIKDFLGRPLIAYSIENALESGIFADVVVSTDDEEIASVARSLGASVPFVRDATLSNDFTGTLPVTIDAYQRMLASKGSSDAYSGVFCIYATAPLLTAAHLKEAYKKVCDTQADYLFASCEFPFPIQRGFYQDESGAPIAVMPECQPMRSQDLPKAYQDAGQFYFYSVPYLNFYALSEEERSKAEKIEQAKQFIMRMYEMPRYRVIDIDTLDDWEYAIMLAKAVKELGYKQ